VTRSCTKCGKPHYARDLCRSHYLEAVRAGDIVVGERGRRLGTSTLTAGMQHHIAELLIEGHSLSSIARLWAVSRDQVRTVRTYLERLHA